MRFAFESRKSAPNPMVGGADVIMVVRGEDEQNRRLAREAILSLRQSETAGAFHVIVADTNAVSPDYPQADRIIHAASPYNYHKILNEAFQLARKPYVILVHPDVVFKKGWWTTLRTAMESLNLASASPRCPVKQAGLLSHLDERHRSTPENRIALGYETGSLLCGWCLALRRSAARLLFPLDERDRFFSHEHEIAQKLAAARMRHGQVGASTVIHRGDTPRYIDIQQDNPLESWSSKADDAAPPQVTLITTAFKRFHTLLGLICAMNSQTRPDWRMHIVSDGDDPDLESKIRPYLGEKIRWSHVAQPDGQPIGDWGFTASNYALMECDTSYVVFTSDDNYYTPTFVESMLGAAEKYRLDFVCCKALHNYERYIYERFCDNELVRGRMDKGQFMVKTELVRKAGGIVGDYPWADGAMIERIVEQNPDLRVMKLESCLYIHN